MAAQRLSRGWTQEELAERAGVSLRTVERIEKGLPAFAATLGQIAEAFGMQLVDLLIQGCLPRLAEADSGPESDCDPGTPVAFSLTLRGDFDRYRPKDWQDLLDSIKFGLKTSGEIRIIWKGPGSIRLTIELTSGQAAWLLRAIEAGFFDSFGVVDAFETPLADAETEVQQAQNQGGAKPWTIYVLKGGERLAEDILRKVFGRYGTVTNVEISGPEAFVEMASKAEAEKAVEDVTNAKLMRVKLYGPRSFPRSEQARKQSGSSKGGKRPPRGETERRPPNPRQPEEPNPSEGNDPWPPEPPTTPPMPPN